MTSVELTPDNFDDVVSGDKPLLVDFWAAWCGPCRVMAPVIEDFSEKHPEMAVGKIDIDKYPDMAQRFNVMSIPTILVFKGSDEPVAKAIGSMSLSTLEEKVLDHV